MSQIHLLEQETIDKIAAGEVIERPSSIVKELVENAIDAGANAVTVEIREGGTAFIRITDNGEGIEKEQVPTAFLRTPPVKSECGRSAAGRLSGLSRGGFIQYCRCLPGRTDHQNSRSLTGCRYLIEGERKKGWRRSALPRGAPFW